VQTLLLAMKDDPSIQCALASIGVDRFVMIDDGAYDSVRTLVGVIPPSVVQP
jgi:hypothetical protein